MKESAMLYNVPDMIKRARLQFALSSIGLPCKWIDRKDYLKPLGQLAGETLFFTTDQEYEGPELSDTMLVLAGLSSERIDAVLRVLRECGAGPLPYKAVLTATNRYWTSLMLFEELKKEHRAMRKD